MRQRYLYSTSERKVESRERELEAITNAEQLRKMNGVTNDATREDY